MKSQVPYPAKTCCLVLTYDGDEAGQRAAQRAIPMLERAGLRIKVLKIRDAKDPDEYLRKFGDARFRRLVEGSRTEFSYKSEKIFAKYSMDIPEEMENITTVLPFKEDSTRYFMTTKQACMPTEGYFRFGDFEYRFSKDTAFCAMDWGRVNTVHKMVWYWGSGSLYHTDEKGEKHLLGFEITWAIGNEKNATETCIFYDGKVHKFGAVDVEKFPKDRFLEEWKFISEDGRFNMTMIPTLDNHSDVDLKIGRMNCHQIFGRWNGDVTLDDGTKIEIKDLFTFCEYVENRW